MTTALCKNAIRARRKAFKRYLSDRKQKNWEDKQKNRNEAVRQRRIARRQYWKKETDDLRENPRNFFQTFKPFLGSSKGVNGSDINFKVDGKIIGNQETVVEILADHFAAIAGLLWDLNSP